MGLASLEKKILLQNRKVAHDYLIESKIEAGLVLLGSEVKSLRNGRGQLTDAHVIVDNGEAFLIHFKIQEYAGANQYNHAPSRQRKLLLKKKQIHQLDEVLRKKGYAVLPLEVLLRGKWVKVLLGICKGKKQYDKRAAEKDRELKREVREFIS